MSRKTVLFSVILGLFLRNCYCPWITKGNSRHKATGPCEMNLTRNVSDLVEGEPVQFTCSRGQGCQLAGLLWFLNGSQHPADEAMNGVSSSNLSLVPHRNYSGLMLECRMNLTKALQPLRKNMTLDVTFPPQSIAVRSSSYSCKGTCRVELCERQTYEFKCQSDDSDPASTFNWSLRDATSRPGTLYPSEYTVQASLLSQARDAGWDATSTVTLNALPEYNSRLLVCSVLHPNNLTVFKEVTSVLRVYTESSMIGPTIVGCIAAGLIALCIISFITTYACLRKRNTQGTSHSEHGQSSVDREELHQAVEMDDVLPECPARLPRSFDRNRITVRNRLGEGSFGVVYKAVADGIIQEGRLDTVAVKMLKTWVPGSGEVSDFLKELDICTTLQEHPHVIRTLGYCIEEEPFCLVFEYAPNGNLANFLIEKKREWRAKGHGEPISSDLIIKFASQIASGMHYLSSIKIVHRDLAARNILLGDSLTCKISDFGLSRDVVVEDLYQMSSCGAVPLRWIALESIVNKIYTTQSDVWSYGILLWEMITMGCHPYPGIEVKDIIQALRNGRRLAKPYHCGDTLYKVMTDCWHPSPSSRPDFDTILQTVMSMADKPSKYLQMSKFTEEY